MLDRADKTLSIRRQCALVGVARSGATAEEAGERQRRRGIVFFVGESKELGYFPE